MKKNDPKGFALIYLIFIMLALGGMGAAIYSFTASSAYTELTENNRNRAYQLAWAGMNYAVEQHSAGVLLDSPAFKNKTYTLNNSRGQFTYTVDLVNHQYNVVSIGTVNNNDGLLLARAQVESRPNQFPENLPEPPFNETIMKNTMQNLNAFKNEDQIDAHNNPMIKVEAYVATGGTHLYWAAFIDQGTYPRPDADNPGCNMGFHAARVHEDYANQLRQSWHSYQHVNYDLQVKAGWYMGLQAAVSGLNVRWHETSNNSGLFEGYGLAFMRYTYSAAGCGVGYDYIPNSIKPPGLANKLLLVLWEQRSEGGVERRRWLAYADLGTPATFPNPRAGNDLKVIGAQDSVDGLLNDDSLLMVRIKDKYIQGQKVNEINVFYGDASPYYAGVRTPNSVCTDTTRKRMLPEWIQPDLFPSWASNKFDVFNYTDSGIPYAIFNFWLPDPNTTSDPTYYDFFTLNSASDKIGPAPPSVNPVRWIINPVFADPEPDPGINPANTNLVKLLPDKATLRTYKFALSDFDPLNQEVGLHAMGNLNSSNRVVAFDDWALQILGQHEK